MNESSILTLFLYDFTVGVTLVSGSMS